MHHPERRVLAQADARQRVRHMGISGWTGPVAQGVSHLEASKWERLFDRFSHRLDALRQKQESERALIAWYDEQTKLVMMLVREVAEERAQAFEKMSGQHVEVAWPSRPPINVDPEGPFMSFMTLSRGEREVHLYSHRLQASPPTIHFVVSDAKRSVIERKRLMSHIGCRVERRTGGGFVLIDATTEHKRNELSADDVAFRAFEYLLAAD